MRRSPLFTLRRLGLDAGRWLGSWRLSIVLGVLAAVYHLLLAVWSASTEPAMVRNIATLLPFWLLWTLLLVNTGTCLLGRRLRLMIRRLGAEPLHGDDPPDWRLEPALSESRVRTRLRRLGYRLRDAPSSDQSSEPGDDRGHVREGDREHDRRGGFVGVARRWSALGTYLFHGAFFLVAAGFLLGLAMRQEERLWVAVGERFTGEPGQVLSRSTPRALAAGVPPVEFGVESIRPVFWRDMLLFTTLEARLDLPQRGSVTTRINKPLWLGWGSFLRLSGFGYAPRWELSDRAGRVLDSAFVKLDVFPPGQRDVFNIPDLPHRFYTEVLPDFAVEEGEAVTRSLNLVQPAVRLHVFRGRFEVGEAVLRQGDAFRFEGLDLRFPEIRYWGELRHVYDPGAPLVLGGYLLGLAGLAVKLRGRRREVRWRPGRAGEPAILEGWGGQPPAGVEEAP